MSVGDGALDVEAIRERNRQGIFDTRDVLPLCDEVERLRARNGVLHQALSEGNGVEDGGEWEDRALVAEHERDEARAALAEAGQVVGELLEVMALYRSIVRCGEQETPGDQRRYAAARTAAEGLVSGGKK